MAHASIQPFGGNRDDQRLATNTAALVNEIRLLRAAWTGKEPEAAQIVDYMPYFDSAGIAASPIDEAEAERLRQESLWAKLDMLAASGYGKINKRTEEIVN